VNAPPYFVLLQSIKKKILSDKQTQNNTSLILKATIIIHSRIQTKLIRNQTNNRITKPTKLDDPIVVHQQQQHKRNKT